MVLNATAISAIGAVFSQFGDLFASAIKRWAGIKDFGRIMPGHGGIVDRLDSIVVTAPVVYMVMIWML
jgi:phosphatidate cytidylyltransferase